MADHDLDPLDRWLNQQVQPLPPPPGTFELITKRARRRKIRKALVSVASAAAVAAAVVIAVPLSMTLHLSTTSSGTNMAAGSSITPSTPSQSAPGHGTSAPGPAASSSTTPSAPSSPTSSSSPASANSTSPGYLPPDYVPSSVTWVSTSTGWVMGPAGTAGQCANKNPDICTSLARTDDGGQTWQGLPAPDTGGPTATTGVTGLRFLNASYGWAFGPQLWATDDGGQHWHQVNTDGRTVTDLETGGPGDRAYALFGNCAPPAGTTGDAIANCTSYTLETTTAGSDNWTPVSGIPANLSLGAGQSGQNGSALIELAGPATSEPAAGYLVAPDGTLYTGPLNGSAWHPVATLPCTPGQAQTDGLPQGVVLAPDGATVAGARRLAIACAQGTATVVYLSANNGSTWTEQATIGSSGAAEVGAPRSLTSLPDGTLILATTTDSHSSGGIYVLSPGATQWQSAALSDPSGHTDGFTYVGMTSATQGVALGGSPSLHAIWMTTDGGRTWQVRPIKS